MPTLPRVRMSQQSTACADTENGPCITCILDHHHPFPSYYPYNPSFMSQQSGSSQPQAGPSNTHHQEPTPLVWNRLPSIKILRPPQGRYSTNADERCFTYCSQTVHGRLSQAEPWCRTVCIRKVFNHEVKRALAVYEQDPDTHSRNLNTVQVDTKFPLPPEGQEAARYFSSLFGLRPPSSTSAQSSRDSDAEWHSISGTSKPVDEQKYWKEGWYLWMSQSRWAAQEKMDLMMCDLEKQAEWQRYKDRVLEDWNAFEQGQLQGGRPISIGDSAMEDHGHGLNPALTVQEKSAGQDHAHDPSATGVPPQPFPDSASQSLLVELPPPLPPLDKSVRAFLAPSFRLLETTRRTIHSGEQARFARQVWDKALTPEPYMLVQKLLRHTWKFWTEQTPEDKDKKGS
ncbi:hypothetical protein BXZ70DRAFT_955478 [Cristinia sonorae]|uniref:Uncharacterized protein n=1 Tax=Cristinia sonorae TaxID=1940300 RepID=A0A8K0XLU1_9AGAR|nr:hypothetical protein BXZ70DRAFT_955478 [Cristinia sonorae]